jgi:hypothetical protein
MRRMPAAWETTKPIEHAVQEKLRTDVTKTRHHLRGVGHLPLDPDQARTELTEEQRAQRASRPRNRRWRALERLDGEVDRLAQRQAAAVALLQEAEDRLARAPEDDARTLADWLAAGEQDERPQASVYERQRERDAVRLRVEAIGVELDRALQRRLNNVRKHRKRMLADARNDVAETRNHLLERIAELPALREQLVATRETLLWIAFYPDPVEAYGFPTAIALGLREPTERTLGTRARVEYTGLRQALDEDASALATEFSREQKQRLGIAGPPTPVDQAMWWDDADHVAWRKAELERARQLAQWQNPDLLAAEVRDP